MSNNFWNFKRVVNEDKTENILTISGYIAQESWFDDDVTPKIFRSELDSYAGDVTVWINSDGGDCFAASEIYTALKEHKGSITVKIDGRAASAASLIAMAGDIVEMSPPSIMMIHNPAMLLFGEEDDFEQGKHILNEVKESIINAYQLKTGLSRTKISNLMTAETYMNVRAAMDYGFCDRMMYGSFETNEIPDSIMFDKTVITNSLSAVRKKLKVLKKLPETGSPENTDQSVLGEPVAQFEKRLHLIK